MQISLPCALFAQGPSELCLKGGTNAEMAPQIDYTLKVRVCLRSGVDRVESSSGCLSYSDVQISFRCSNPSRRDSEFSLTAI